MSALWYRFRACILISELSTNADVPCFQVLVRRAEYRREELGSESTQGLRARIVSTEEAINANEDINPPPPASVRSPYFLQGIPAEAPASPGRPRRASGL